MRGRVWITAAALLAALLTGCFQTEKPRAADPGADSLQATGPEGKPLLTQQELSSLVRGFADKYVAMNNQALDEIVRAGVDSRARAIAQGRKAMGAATVYAIATKPNAEIALLDMAVQVTLEREVWTRGYAEEIFGKHAPILDDAYDRFDADIWALAGRVFTEAQLDGLRDAIEKWIVDNPRQRYLAFTQVEDFAKLREASSLGDVGSPGGLTMLAPINEATRAADEIRLLGERALFLTQRLPSLVEAQAEFFASSLLDKPEVSRALSGMRDVPDALQGLAAEIHSVPEVVKAERKAVVDAVAAMLAAERQALLDGLHATVAAEREALFRDLETNTGAMRTALADLRETVRAAGPLTTEAKDAAAALRDAAGSAERLLSSLDPDGEGPAKSGESITQARAALTELAATAKEIRGLIESKALDLRVNQVDAVAAARIAHIGRWGLGLIGAFFGLLAAYRYYSLALRRRMAPGA